MSSLTARQRDQGDCHLFSSIDLHCQAGISQIYCSDAARACQYKQLISKLVTIDPITRLDLALDARPIRQDSPPTLESTTEPTQTTPPSSTSRLPILQTQPLNSLVPATRPRTLVEDSEGDAPSTAPSSARNLLHYYTVSNHCCWLRFTKTLQETTHSEPSSHHPTSPLLHIHTTFFH